MTLNTAYIFPGQGSQSVGMLADFGAQNPIITDIFSIVSESLGYDLWDLIQNGPEETLNKTEHTQVAMLTADVAIYRLLEQQGVPAPKLMAGHSLGEYAALVCANAISLSDAAYLVAKRGQIMQETVPLGEGAMAAIVGLTDEQVKTICDEASTDVFQVSPANYNAIGQVVIAGHAPAVEKAIAQADETGARLAKLIPVSVPCHCALLKEAANRFLDNLQQAPFKTPVVPVISNVDLSIYQSAEQIRSLLAEQLYSPVRWVETIQMMKAKNIELIVECGPGSVLSGLIKRIDRSLRAVSVNNHMNFEQALTLLTNK